jgi:UDP-N-acetyl-D-mannosaminuronic acid dehydrogenase
MKGSVSAMRRDYPKVCVIGMGYIGLPTAALLATHGIEVTGVDINPSVVQTINSGKVHIVEPDLDWKVHRAVQSGFLTAKSEPESADVFLIAVPTPLAADKRPVVDHVFSAAEAIAPYLRPGGLVILESTSPVGTTEQLCKRLAERRPDLRFPIAAGPAADADIAVAYCPERVLPGRILTELVDNDRCVGGMSPACAAQARSFYEHFVRGSCIETSARKAEMVKLTENAFRDLNIAFANELSMICEELDVDVWDLIALANRHPRVQILKPGPGVGGHCIAVDPWFIVDAAPDQARLIRTAREVNDAKTRHVLARVRALIDQHPHRRVSCLGLTFKANVDDLRESPALEIVERLAEEHGARIGAVEPFISRLPEPLIALGVQQQTLEEALGAGNILVLLVDHHVFRDIDRSRLAGAVIYDTRGIWSGSAAQIGKPFQPVTLPSQTAAA